MGNELKVDVKVEQLPSHACTYGSRATPDWIDSPAYVHGTVSDSSDGTSEDDDEEASV